MKITVFYNETYAINKINYHLNMPVYVISDNKKITLYLLFCTAVKDGLLLKGRTQIRKSVKCCGRYT
jgi:hypothetical protein